FFCFFCFVLCWVFVVLLGWGGFGFVVGGGVVLLGVGLGVLRGLVFGVGVFGLVVVVWGALCGQLVVGVVFGFVLWLGGVFLVLVFVVGSGFCGFWACFGEL
ncbi:hypothetical protein RA274_27720, partial [Pseudomonas syringae pv. tagetis]|uniref:hypothetical protein n=1 Tax=Pseudomonas syringae group genomosp. 7 TaxID=251699 RepID=UPI00376F5008